jgi:hypothetical protein
LHCFLAYVAIITQDTTAQEQLAYARLMIRESLSHPGPGWLEYDRVFRQQRALDSGILWSSLHPRIHSATILSQNRGPSQFCSLCHETDHTARDCALWYLRDPPAVTSVQSSIRRPRESVCRSWNTGRCVFPGSCNYRHICSICQSRHQPTECPKRVDRDRPVRTTS